MIRLSNRARYIAIIQDIISGQPYKTISQKFCISVFRISGIRKQATTDPHFQKILKKSKVEFKQLSG